MATITYHNVGVKAMAACVPSAVAYNKDLACLMSQEEVDKMNAGLVRWMYVHLIYAIRQH